MTIDIHGIKDGDEMKNLFGTKSPNLDRICNKDFHPEHNYDILSNSRKCRVKFSRVRNPAKWLT